MRLTPSTSGEYVTGKRLREIAFPTQNSEGRTMTSATGQAPRVLRIAMNGITGRMGYRQHLLRSILPIRDAGGFTLEDGTRVQVEPSLVGRNEAKIRELAEKHKVSEWTTDLDAVINDPTVNVVFDPSIP